MQLSVQPVPMMRVRSRSIPRAVLLCQHAPGHGGRLVVEGLQDARARFQGSPFRICELSSTGERAA
eukprot:11159448-Lingulodinium_polyedra.AAC.1